jgi:type VI secretion system protein ImpB
VVGILAPLAGAARGGAEDPSAQERKWPLLRDRKFVEIDADNFDEVMADIAPCVKTNGTVLRFKKLEDFEPKAIVSRVEKLTALHERRRKLNDLLAKLDGNDELTGLLAQVAGQEKAVHGILEALPPAADERQKRIAGLTAKLETLNRQVAKNGVEITSTTAELNVAKAQQALSDLAAANAAVQAEIKKVTDADPKADVKAVSDAQAALDAAIAGVIGGISPANAAESKTAVEGKVTALVTAADKPEGVKKAAEAVKDKFEKTVVPALDALKGK